MVKVLFINHGVTSRLAAKTALKKTLLSLFHNEGVPLNELTVIFCSDPYLRKINKKFLQHDYNTDVITFPLSENGEPVVGEIYVSPVRVRENARIYKSPYHTEMHRVVIHGALHLCGYLDHTPRQKALIRKKEDQYLEMIGST